MLKKGTQHTACSESANQCADNSKCCSTFGISKDLQAGYNKLSILSEQKLRRDSWGHECSSTIDKDVEDLCTYLEVLEDEKDKLSQGYQPCLKCEDLTKLREKIKLASMGCQGQYELCEKDESNREIWKLANPNCFAYEVWEKCLIDFCAGINVNFEAIKSLPNKLIVDIATEEIPLSSLSIHAEDITKTENPIRLNINSVEHKDESVKLKIEFSEEKKNLILNAIVSEVSSDELKIVAECLDTGLTTAALNIVYQHGISLSQGKLGLDVIIEDKAPLNAKKILDNESP